MGQSHKTALVTGASRGIGAVISKALCGDSIAVTAAGRSESALRVFADETGCAALALDLADMDAAFDGNENVMKQKLFKEHVALALGKAGGININGTLAKPFSAEELEMQLELALRRRHLNG